MTRTETISSFFKKDHGRLDQLFYEFLETRKRNLLQAKKSFIAFKNGLLKHIGWEENLLFPVFESKTDFRDAGPTAVMRFEHEQIKKALHNIASALDRGEPGNDTAEGILVEVLVQHNIKEESILYPIVDQLLTDEEFNEIFNQIQKSTDHESSCCCGMDI